MTNQRDEEIEANPRRDTRPIQRRAVLLCGEDMDLSPGLVRLIDVAWRREVCIEVVVAVGDDPMRALTQRYRFAVFLLVRSGESLRAAELRASFAEHRAAGHSLVEIDARDLDDEGPVLETIEQALRGVEAPDIEVEAAPPPRRGRRLICTDAVTLAGALRRG